MSDRPKLTIVSPLDLYLQSPSTGGFLELLRAIRDRTIAVDDTTRAQLELATRQSSVDTSSCIFDFDAKLWQILTSVKIAINWCAVLTGREKESKNSAAEVDVTNTGAPLSSADKARLQEIGYNIASAEITKRGDEVNIRRETGSRLVFFAEVNHYIFQNETFLPFKVTAQALEDLLIELCQEQVAPEANAVVLLDDRDWRWLAQGVASAYLSILAVMGSRKDEDDINLKSQLLCAQGMALAQSTLFYQGALVSGYPADPSIFKSILRVSEDFSLKTLKESPYAKLAFHFESQQSNPEDWSKVQAALFLGCALLFTRSECWQFFIWSWYRDYFSLDDKYREENKEEIFFLVKYVCFASGDRKSISKKRLQENYISFMKSEITEFDSDKVKHALVRYNLGNIPSTELACFLLRDVRDFDLAEVDTLLGYVGSALIWEIHEQERSDGRLPRIPFVENIAHCFADGSFIRKRAIFYESIPTLAINLAEREVSYDHFDTNSSSDCYLAATKALANAGFREYSAVFLAYALLRAHFIISSEVDVWGIKRLDAVCRKTIGDKFLRQYILPVLRLIQETSTNQRAAAVQLDFQFKHWCRSILAEYDTPNAPTLTLVPRHSELVDEIALPEWFAGGEEVVLQPLRRVRNALNAESPSAAQWTQLMNHHHVQEAIGELLRQLEAQLQMFFQEAYDAFYSDSEFKNVYSATTLGTDIKPSRDNPSWGWIEMFLGNIAIVRDVGDTARNLKALRRLANQAKPGLGEVLSAINGRKEIVSSLKQAREIDNEFTSHNRPIKPPDRAANTRGIVHKRRLSREQVAWVYNYVTVDFGLLFDILRPMVSDTDSGETD